MNKNYYLIIGDKKIYVSRKVARAYWRYESREKYQKLRDKKYNVYPFSSFTHRGKRIEDIPDPSDVEEYVILNLEIEALKGALRELTDEERDIITKLFYEDRSTREIARMKKRSQSWVMKRKNEILIKLKDKINSEK